MKLWRFEIKRRENTVWDYLVPLSLVLLSYIYYIYYSWSCFYDYSGERILDTSNMNIYIIIGLVTFPVFIFSTFYLTRLQRIVIFPFLMTIIAWATLNSLELIKLFSNKTSYKIYDLFVIVGGLSFFFGNLVLLIRYGKKQVLKAKYSPLRTFLSWGIFGSIIFFVQSFGTNQPCWNIGGGPHLSPRISDYDLIYTAGEFAGIEILLLFALIGLAVEIKTRRRITK